MPGTPGTHPATRPQAAPQASPAAFRDRVRRTTVIGMQGPPSPQRTGLSACQDPYEDHPHIMQMRCELSHAPHLGHESARECRRTRQCTASPLSVAVPMLAAWIPVRQRSGGQMCGSVAGASMTRPPLRLFMPGMRLAAASVPRSGARISGPGVRRGRVSPVPVWHAGCERRSGRCALERANQAGRWRRRESGGGVVAALQRRRPRSGRAGLLEPGLTLTARRPALP